MDNLLGAMTLEQKLGSLAVLALTAGALKLLPWLSRAVLKHEDHLPPPAIIILQGDSDEKSELINSLRQRFRHSHRSFMLVSHAELCRSLLPEQVTESIANDETSAKGERYISGIHRSWEALVSCGNNLIIDFTIDHADSVSDFLACFNPSYAKNMLLINSKPNNPLPLPPAQVIEKFPDADTVARELAILGLI